MKRSCPPLALLLLNLWIAGRLLAIEYLDQMGSIESTHITLARWVRENWHDLGWFPLWYGGIPWQNTYPPLLHLIVAALGAMSPAHAYHAVTAAFYCLGPVTLYWLALRLCGSRACSFAAGLFYSLVSTSAFLIPAVRRGGLGFSGPRRLQAMVQFGEGPHVAAMTLLPLAILLLSLALEKRRWFWWMAAALGMASVALTNWLGAVALAMGVTAWLLARREGLLKVAAVAALAYLIASPWIPPSTIRTIAANERFVSGPLAAPVLRIAIFLAAAVAAWVIWRCKAAAHIRFSLLFLLFTALPPLASAWGGVQLIPQADRYHLEMEMALALAGAFLVWEWLPRRRLALACLLLLFSVYPALKCFKHAQWLIRPIQIERTIEYREAMWFDQHMQGRRVFAPGSVGFFLNVFTDTPQFAGGFDQGVINSLWPHAQYQILSGEEGAVAILWLKSFGVDGVAVCGPRSHEYYKPFHNPGKFDGLLTELWRDGDDVIYGLGRRSTSLAHVIQPADLAPRPPAGGLDVDPLRPYVAAMDNPAYPLAEMTWYRHSGIITSRLEKGQILSVQMSFHPGWRASVNGQPRRTYRDNLGQLVIEPDCEGACTVEIRYTQGLAPQLLP